MLLISPSKDTAMPRVLSFHQQHGEVMKIARDKFAFLGLAAAIGLAAPAASAANPHQSPAGPPGAPWSFSSLVTKVTVVDRSLQDGNAGTYVQIDLATPGTVCGTAGVGIVYILRSDHPEQFDHWVRLAQAAFMSGKRITYASARRTASPPSTCYTWYLSLRD